MTNCSTSAIIKTEREKERKTTMKKNIIPKLVMIVIISAIVVLIGMMISPKLIVGTPIALVIAITIDSTIQLLTKKKINTLIVIEILKA